MLHKSKRRVFKTARESDSHILGNSPKTIGKFLPRILAGPKRMRWHIQRQKEKLAKKNVISRKASFKTKRENRKIPKLREFITYVKV